jgi:hypothetical protein
MQCLSMNAEGGFNTFFEDDLGEEDHGPDGQWFVTAFRSTTPSPQNGHMSEWSSPWHHLSSPPNAPPCCGHAMSSLWHFRVNKVQVFRRKSPGGVVSVQSACCTTVRHLP